MNELEDGLYAWTTRHPNIGVEVSSYFHAPSRTLIDPFAPVYETPLRHHPPQRIVMTNRHHVRDVAELADRFECPVLCERRGLDEFEGSELEGRVEGFAAGEEVAPGVTALPNGAITPEEVSLLIEAGPGALHFADGIHHYGDELGFFSDELLGDDPETVRDSIRHAARELLSHDFDDLLFAHGEPIVGDGKRLLRGFIDAG